MDRYSKATAAEKAMFTLLATLIGVLSHLAPRHRELKGNKSTVKFNFPLKANNPHIHILEFRVKKGVISHLVLTVARTCIDSDFYKRMIKLGAKATYGGIVLSWPTTEEEAPTLLAEIDKAAGESEEIALNPKRTYCDPPAGWVKDLTGKEGVIKEPTPEEAEEPKAEAEDSSEAAA